MKSLKNIFTFAALATCCSIYASQKNESDFADINRRIAKIYENQSTEYKNLFSRYKNVSNNGICAMLAGGILCMIAHSKHKKETSLDYPYLQKRLFTPHTVRNIGKSTIMLGLCAQLPFMFMVSNLYEAAKQQKENEGKKIL